ncbi:MAG: alpha/beta fold hydrolase [Candidatus Omnitrophica bacterium]|nr:alpha/beta fold hydrolase [Candidatus Omnitrophota bacterium]MDD5436955.1 alpha/beta fold hydrolase [Candidatus Omnitrophota bacterium]
MKMRNEKNMDIGYRQWRPPSPRAVFLLVHGIGAHSGRWEAMADFFLLNGIASYAIDLKDFDPHGVPDDSPNSFRDYSEKILRLYDIASKENPAKKVFLVGESMGALVSFLFVCVRSDPFDGLICLSPAFANRYKPALMDRLKMLACLVHDKKRRFKLPFDSSMCTRDDDYRRRLDQDPREYRSIPAGEIFDILAAQFRARFIKNKIGVPVLFLVAGDDTIVDPEAARKVFKGLAAADKTLVELPGMRHALSIELGREKVFAEILKWTEKRV